MQNPLERELDDSGGDCVSGGRDVFWYGTGPRADLSYDSRSLAFCLHAASQGDDDIYVMINAYWDGLKFQVQEGTAQEWMRIVDTTLSRLGDFFEGGDPLRTAGYNVAARSVVVLPRSRNRSGRKEREDL
jgi:isoamylase